MTITSNRLKQNVLRLFLVTVLLISQLMSAVAIPTVTAADTQTETDTLVEWDFDKENPAATSGIESNTSQELTIVGANHTGYVAGFGSNSRAINSNGWNSSDESYWLAQFSTEGYESITFSSRQFGSNTGPKDFTVEYSLDGENWSKVQNTDIEVGNNWTSGVLTDVLLPSEVDNEEIVYLRWLNTSGVSINNGNIGSTGTNRIDNIVISGVPISGEVPGESELPGTPEEPGDEKEKPEYISISEARAQLGQEVTVLGVANIDQGLLQKSRFSLYLQDGDAGIQLFNFNDNIFPAVKEGDLVKATGTVGEFNNVTQLEVTEVDVLESNQDVEVKSIDLSTYMNATSAEALEGQLVQFDGYIRNINDYHNGGVTISIINEGFDAVDIRVWETTGIDLSQLEEHTWYEITAISSQFNGTYQVLPRSNADFVISDNQRPEPTTLDREFQAVVSHVTDGDTIRLESPIFGATNVRFLNMDTPETYHTVRNELDENQMRHGNLATAHMQTMLSAGDTVIIRLGEEPLDGYGRLLAEVITLDGVNTNLEMVRAGFASTYFIYPFEDDTVEEYAEAAKYARENQLGIYNPEDLLFEMPFVFRARERGDNGLSRYVGNFITKEYVAPDHYEAVPPEYRVFFTRTQAMNLGYTSMQLTDRETVDLDKNALGVGFQGTDSTTNVLQDVVLETTGTYGSTIIWESSNENVLSNTGEVTNPQFDGVQVTLTATIQKGELVETKEIVLTVNPLIFELVSWNFDGESEVATGGLVENASSQITHVGASISGYVAGYGSGSRALNASGWDTEEAYWVVEFSTLGYQNITLSSRQYGSNTGPRDFIVQYSIDGESWVDVHNSEVVVGNNWTSGVLENIALPEEVNNQDTVYVRWINVTDTSINGTTIGSGGTSRIDNIFLFGNEGSFGEENPGEQPVEEEPTQPEPIFPAGKKIVEELVVDENGLITVEYETSETGVLLPIKDMDINESTHLVLGNEEVSIDVPSTVLQQLKELFDSLNDPDAKLLVSSKKVEGDALETLMDKVDNKDNLVGILKTIASNIYDFEIGIYKTTGEVVKLSNFNGELAVKLHLTVDFDKEEVAIYHISTDGSLTEMGGTVEGDFITVNLSSFSMYAALVMEVNEETVLEGPVDEENSDNLPDDENGNRNNEQEDGHLNDDITSDESIVTGKEKSSSDQEKVDNKVEEGTDKLPETATSMFNYLLIGLLLIIIGLVLARFNVRKSV
ncbi:immunoglobulin-like domain-containing protein [Evansella tamaricis]|uniref:Thermonuclease family protein n=1 Tax=Evansella tamaricis TaxID=2069301 RepID=A0ABS6J9P4_9BACI|nr:immunoglobulin-like domain-containing protein [Evansella tamaricis]MBU9710406.1 thermonuclease family protein [Evansella tamaricis]